MFKLFGGGKNKPDSSNYDSSNNPNTKLTKETRKSVPDVSSDEFTNTENRNDQVSEDNYISHDQEVEDGNFVNLSQTEDNQDHHSSDNFDNQNESDNDSYQEDDFDPKNYKGGEAYSDEDDDNGFSDDFRNGSDKFTDDDIKQFKQSRNTPSTILGQPSLINIIGPSYWSSDDDMQDEFVIRENQSHRTYGFAAYIPQEGYPRMLDTTVFQELLAQKNVDLTLDIVPRSRNASMKDLARMQNNIRANAYFQEQKGQNFQLRDNIVKFEDIDSLLDQIQFDENREYDLATSLIVYGNSERDLRSNIDTVTDILGHKNISIYPFVKREKSGYFQTIPIGARLYNIDDIYRNVDRRSLSVMNIARNATGIFNQGIPIGINLATPSQNTEFLNIFGTDIHRPDNYNVGIVGSAGGGKSTANKLKIAREVSILGWEHRIIDPEGEYIALVQKLGGLSLTIRADADFVINPLAISTTETPLDEEIMRDALGHQMSPDEVEQEIKLQNNGAQVIEHDDGEKFIKRNNISAAIENAKRFIDVLMTSEGDAHLNVSESSRIGSAMSAIIKRMGITSDPDSLLENRAGHVGTHYYSRVPKPEPTLTDLYNELKAQNTDEQGNEDPKVSRVLDALTPYLTTGSKPLFDGQTYFGRGLSQTLDDFKLINFNIHELQGSLRGVAYYVIEQYLWERWINNPAKALVKKVLDCDEILQFATTKQTFGFLENIVRADRKRNCSLTWMTQDFEPFKDNNNANALILNSEFMFFFKTGETYRKVLKETFGLSDGALDILINQPDKGEGILREEGTDLWIQTNPSDDEWSFAESNKAVGQARENLKQADQVNRTVEG